jgi:hypothetical protein
MLSQNAWNAFLKTLEEPPPHVKFIFATTEVHKVPVTILSRCQRYDFKLIPTQLIAKRLRYVLGEEKIEADDAAVALVAREGAGSLRDAMSLLDQAIAWGGEKLVGSEVSRVLGVAARSVIHQIAQGLIAGDAAQCLGIVADLSDQGYDVTQVARGILAELRDLVVAKVCREPDRLLDLADEENAQVKALAASADADDLLRLHPAFDPFDRWPIGRLRGALECSWWAGAPSAARPHGRSRGAVDRTRTTARRAPPLRAVAIGGEQGPRLRARLSGRLDWSGAPFRAQGSARTPPPTTTRAMAASPITSG